MNVVLYRKLRATGRPVTDYQVNADQPELFLMQDIDGTCRFVVVSDGCLRLSEKDV